LRLLIICPPIKSYHLTQFGKSLTQHNIEYKIISDIDFLFSLTNLVQRFLLKKKFQKILKEFKPNLVLLDRQSILGLYVKEEKIPLAIIVRGDIWKEAKIATDVSNSLIERITIKYRQSIINKCLEVADVILPISDYLTNIVKTKYPTKQVKTLYISARDPVFWNTKDRMNLQHPCVGLLQGANIWGKTKEMLILSEILNALPKVTFYWGGDGQYSKKILSTLNKHKNFVWLGSLEYPNKVREYLADVDIFALVSSMDSFGQVILEASLMEKPVLATNVGGTSETIKDDQTGYLIEKGDVKGWIDKITLLLNDEKKARSMGAEGRKFVSQNFSWEKIAKDFVNITAEIINKR